MHGLNCAIPKDVWAPEPGARNGIGVAPAKGTKEIAGDWDTSIQKIIELDQLGDNWDGLGASAPSRELIQSAVRLAHLLCAGGVEPPQSVVPGLDGSINFGWQDGSGYYAEIEIVRPFFAEVMVIEPGKPAKHWTLPAE